MLCSHNLNQPKMTKIYSSLSILISLFHFFQTSHAKCTPSACGVFPNITTPFRLKGDSKYCGDRKFELACENDVASVNLNSQKYYVKAINYSSTGYINTRIRLADASVKRDDVCSFPEHSAYAYNFTPANYPHYRHPYLTWSNFSHLNFMSCTKPLRNSSLFTEITGCGPSTSDATYAYIKIGRMKIAELPDTCEFKVVVMTSWDFKDLNNVSLLEIHESLLYGFELSTFCPECGVLTVWGT